MGGASAFYAAAEFGQTDDTVYAIHTPGFDQSISQQIINKGIESNVLNSEIDLASRYGQSLPVSASNNVWMLQYGESEAGVESHTFNPTTSLVPALGMQLGTNRNLRTSAVDIQKLESFEGSQQINNGFTHLAFDAGLGLIDFLRETGARPYYGSHEDIAIHGNEPLGSRTEIGIGVEWRL